MNLLITIKNLYLYLREEKLIKNHKKISIKALELMADEYVKGNTDVILNRYKIKKETLTEEQLSKIMKLEQEIKTFIC